MYMSAFDSVLQIMFAFGLDGHVPEVVSSARVALENKYAGSKITSFFKRKVSIILIYSSITQGLRRK